MNPSEKYESNGIIVPNIWKVIKNVPNHQPGTYSTMWGLPVISWFISPSNYSYLRTINHSYWSYLHNLAIKRGPHILPLLSKCLLCDTSLNGFGEWLIYGYIRYWKKKRTGHGTLPLSPTMAKINLLLADASHLVGNNHSATKKMEHRWNLYWLVVEPPLWKIWVNWGYYSQYMEK